MSIDNTRRRGDNKNKRRYLNQNQENYLGEASATTRSELGGYGSTTTGGTGSIFIAGIFIESEYSMNVNNNTHNNDETEQVADIIDSESDSYEGSKFKM